MIVYKVVTNQQQFVFDVLCCKVMVTFDMLQHIDIYTNQYIQVSPRGPLHSITVVIVSIITIIATHYCYSCHLLLLLATVIFDVLSYVYYFYLGPEIAFNSSTVLCIYVFRIYIYIYTHITLYHIILQSIWEILSLNLKVH